MKLIVRQIDLQGEPFKPEKYYREKPFNGLAISQSSIISYTDGSPDELIRHFEDGHIKAIFTSSGEYTYNGFYLAFEVYNSISIGELRAFAFWDCGLKIESFMVKAHGELANHHHINDDKNEKDYWGLLQSYDAKNPYSESQSQYLHFYNQQNELKEKTITNNQLPDRIKYIAGAEVVYNELEERILVGIVILDADTLQIIEELTHEETVNYTHVPGFFAFREVPPILEAFKKLSAKPDLIICNSYGIAHPKSVGMATQLGIQTGIPTIGCATKRLVGYYEQPGQARGDNTTLQFNNKEVGKALRTQNDAPPVFVSIGHKISLQTACDWILHLTQTDHLPQTTRAVNTLTSKHIQERTSWDTPLSFYLKKMEE